MIPSGLVRMASDTGHDAIHVTSSGDSMMMISSYEMYEKYEM